MAVCLGACGLRRGCLAGSPRDWVLAAVPTARERPPFRFGRPTLNDPPSARCADICLGKKPRSCDRGLFCALRLGGGTGKGHSVPTSLILGCGVRNANYKFVTPNYGPLNGTAGRPDVQVVWARQAGPR